MSDKELIKQSRALLFLKQREIAELTGFSGGTISGWELGTRSVHPSAWRAVLEAVIISTAEKLEKDFNDWMETLPG